MFLVEKKIIQKQNKKKTEQKQQKAYIMYTQY